MRSRIIAVDFQSGVPLSEFDGGVIRVIAPSLKNPPFLAQSDKAYKKLRSARSESTVITRSGVQTIGMGRRLSG